MTETEFTVSPEKLDRILDKVRKMMALADDPRTPEHEADNARQRAEQFMMDYRIAEEDLKATGAAPSMKPMTRVWQAWPGGSPFHTTYSTILSYVIHHAGVRCVADRQRSEDGSWWYVARTVGFESDLRYAEMLYQAARIAFASRMEPKHDERLSDEDNVFAMRNAGIERVRIAVLMGWAQPSDIGNNKWDPAAERRLAAGAARATRVYKVACRTRGVDAVLTGKGTSVKLYREFYASQFTDSLRSRLGRMRDGVDTERGALVLKSRKEDVDEAFYREFPSLRPTKSPATRPKQMMAALCRAAKDAERADSPGGRAGRSAGHRAATEADLGSGAASSNRLQA